MQAAKHPCYGHFSVLGYRQDTAHPGPISALRHGHWQPWNPSSATHLLCDLRQVTHHFWASLLT